MGGECDEWGGMAGCDMKGKKTETDFFLELEALALVLILELVLLDLDPLEGFDGELYVVWEALDVAGALSEEARDLAVDEAEHCVVGGAGVLCGLVVFRDVGDGGAGEACGDGSMCEGSVLGGGCGEVVLGDGHGGGHSWESSDCSEGVERERERERGSRVISTHLSRRSLGRLRR